LAVTALEKMRANNINQLVAVDNEKYVGILQKYVGILHLQELIKEGII